MGLNVNILKHNADLLFNDLVHRKYANNIVTLTDKERNLTVDSEGRLSTISRFNFLGRLVKWLCNYKGSVDTHVNAIVLQTLKDINQHNLQHSGDKKHMIYLRRRTSNDIYVNNAKFFFIFDAERAYSKFFPAYYLENSLLKCSRFQNNTEIIAALEQIKSNNYPDFKQVGLPGQDNKVKGWDVS